MLNLALGEHDLRKVKAISINYIIIIVIMKAMYQLRINNFENERSTEYECELRSAALGEISA